MNPLTRLPRTAAFALLLWALVTYTAWAAPEPDPPPWRQNLTCQPATQEYRGVEYCTGLAGQAHVIVVDLRRPGVRLEYVIAEVVDRNGQFGECEDVNSRRWGPVRVGCAEPKNRAYYTVTSLDEAIGL